jgi:1-acyl-sn-glycerol-3-phosphate acyltransferase
MSDRIISTIYLIFIMITCAVLFVPAITIWLVTLPFDKRKVIQHQYTCFWGALYTWCFPFWRVHVTGRKNIRRNITYVIVSNHQSQLDILLAFNLFRHFKWVSKAEVFKLPFVGWNMYLNRYVRLVRGDKESVEKMMATSEERLREGSSVYICPEGTRSMDGKVKKFKPGAFILAHRMKTPIIPIAISGTCKALPKYSMNTSGIQHLYLDIMPEVPYEKFASLSIEDTTELIRGIIIKRVDELVDAEERRKNKVYTGEQDGLTEEA